MPVLPRPLARVLAGPGIEDALRVAGELVADGRLVSVEHVPPRSADAAAEIDALLGRLHAVGLAPHTEVTLPVDRLGGAGADRLAARAGSCGIGVTLSGPAADVDRSAAGLPDAGVVVVASDDDAESRCRAFADGRVRLVDAPGGSSDLAFVRCLNILMAGGGRPAVATTDPRLIAITGERAAWNGRSPDSWEHLMPYGVRTEEQHRLVAAGYTVRVAVPSGRGAAAALGPVAVLRRLAGRS